MTYRDYESSWSKLKDNNGGGTIITPTFKPVKINYWDLSLTGYLYEIPDSFWFDEDDEGGIGGVTFTGTAILMDGADSIEFDFWTDFVIFGDPNNPDRFVLQSEDRGLDKESGTEFHIDPDNPGTTLEIHHAIDVIEENRDEIFDALYDMVFDNLDAFGY